MQDALDADVRTRLQGNIGFDLKWSKANQISIEQAEYLNSEKEFVDRVEQDAEYGEAFDDHYFNFKD